MLWSYPSAKQTSSVLLKPKFFSPRFSCILFSRVLSLLPSHSPRTLVRSLYYTSICNALLGFSILSHLCTQNTLESKAPAQ